MSPIVEHIDKIIRNYPPAQSRRIENALQKFLHEYLQGLEFQQERSEFLDFSADNLGRAYSDDEPEYTDADLKWKNPEYRSLQ